MTSSFFPFSSRSVKTCPFLTISPPSLSSVYGCTNRSIISSSDTSSPPSLAARAARLSSKGANVTDSTLAGFFVLTSSKSPDRSSSPSCDADCKGTIFKVSSCRRRRLDAILADRVHESLFFCCFGPTATRPYMPRRRRPTTTTISSAPTLSSLALAGLSEMVKSVRAVVG